MVALRLVWHLWLPVPSPWLASAAGLSSFGGCVLQGQVVSGACGSCFLVDLPCAASQPRLCETQLLGDLVGG